MANTAAALAQENDEPETILDHRIDSEQLDIPGMLLKAKKDSGRSTLSIAKEMGHFVLGKAKLQGDQYFAWRLYDDKKFTKEQKAAFIGAARSRRINRAINNAQHILDYVDNKVLFGATLTATGIRYPEPVAIVSEKRLPQSMGWLRNEDEISAFLRQTKAYPLFGKPVGQNASQSAGVASLSGYESQTDSLIAHDGEKIPVPSFAKEIIKYYASGQYLFQKRVFPHPEIEKACGSGLGTVRIVTVHEEHGVSPLYAAWKITAKDAVADNFWRKGNMLAAVNLETGILERVRTGGGFRFEEAETHPETGARLLGMQLPDWEDAITTVCDAHSLVPKVGIIGWDLALSSNGPTVIEANTFPNHTLYQDATGHGVFSDALLKGVHDRAVARSEAALAKAKSDRKSSKRAWRRRELSNVRQSLQTDT